MTNPAKLWIGVVSLLVVAVISYSVVMALGSPKPATDSTGAPSTSPINRGEVAEEEPENVTKVTTPKYVTVDGQTDLEQLASVVIDASPEPGTDVVTITVAGSSLVVDIDWSDTKGGIVTYDRLTWNDPTGELLSLVGPYEMSADGFVRLDAEAMIKNPGQIFFSTVEGRYYRYDPKSEPRLVLIKTNN